MLYFRDTVKFVVVVTKNIRAGTGSRDVPFQVPNLVQGVVFGKERGVHALGVCGGDVFRVLSPLRTVRTFPISS